MKNYLSLLTALSALLFSIACNKDDDGSAPAPPPSSTYDYLIFGHYYGMCGGEECVEVFRLNDKRLQEDTTDQYPILPGFYNGSFITLDNAEHKLVKDLITYFPDSLLTRNDTVFGCPDCADQGGLYIEYHFNSIDRYWRIDQAKRDVPAYLHDFMDKVNEKIALINQ